MPGMTRGMGRTGPVTQPEHLHKQTPEGVQVLLAEVTEGPKIRAGVRRQHAEGHVLLEATGDLPRSPHAQGERANDRALHRY